MVDDGKRILANLPLQILLYFNYYYLIVYFWLMVATFVYKDYKLTYPDHAFGLDVSVFVFFILLDSSQGNKKEELPILLWSLLLSMVSVVGAVYLIELQTYIIKVELAMHAIYLGFLGFEFVFSLWALHQFYYHDRF